MFLTLTLSALEVSTERNVNSIFG